MPPHGLFQDSIDELKQGENIKREIKGGETHSFGLTMQSGQYARASVVWQGIDLNVFVTKPDGQRISKFNIKVGGPGATHVSIVADQPGLYKLNVSPSEELLVTGSYEVKLEGLRAPTIADESSFAAENALAEAEDQKSKEAAIVKYNEAIQFFRKAEDAGGEACAIRALANRYMLWRDLKNAEENFNAAIALRRKMGDPLSEAYLVSDLGWAYMRLSSQEQALDFFNQALKKFVEVKDRRGEALARYSIGFASARLGKRSEALKFYQEALGLYQAEEDRLSVARTLNAMGGLYMTLGEPDKALELYQRAAPTWRELNDREREAVTINNVGLVYDDWGDWQQAAKNYDDALSVYKSLLKGDWTVCGEGASQQQARICIAAAGTMDNKGEMYNSLGSPQVATEIFKESLSISRKLEQPMGISRTLRHLCYASFLQRRYEEALGFCNESLPYGEKATDYPGQAATLTVLGMIKSALNEPQKALEYYSRAMSLKQTPTRRATAITLDKMGVAHASAGNMKEAFQSYERALQLWREVKDRDGEALTLFNMARAERGRDNLEEAHKLIERTTALVESLRVNITSRQLRAYYFATKVDSYELDIDLKMQLARKGGDELAASALQVNERARARSLLDMLTEARIEVLPSASPELKRLLENRAHIQRKLNDKTRALTSLLNGKYLKEQADSMAVEIDRLYLEYDDNEARIKMQNPRYASLTRPRPLSLNEIQRELLDEQTLLLEYALGEQRSYLWLVSSTGLKWYELPRRAEIEAAARRFKQAIADYHKASGETPLAYGLRLPKAKAEFRAASASLSHMLLAQAGAELKDKRLLIVAEGELQSIPFGALDDPYAKLSASQGAASAQAGATSSSEPQPIVAGHETISLPSATTLSIIRGDQRTRSANKSVAVLADPVFDKDDARLVNPSGKRTRGKAPAPKPRPSEQVLREYALPPLPASKQEAKDIMAVVPSGTGLEALGFKANRAMATDPSLGQYRVVHFATHSLFNDDYPEMSGIVLSLYDEGGRPQEDGFLRLQDIYNLKLPVDMVVLSACQTALGKNVRGEGLIGLTRGFMYAGAARVVASLWKVDDEATAELMKRFYHHLFRERLTPAASLQAAQLYMRKHPRWGAPFFWAGFVLQGEWK